MAEGVTDEDIRAVEATVDNDAFTIINIFSTVNETWIRTKLYEMPMEALVEFIALNIDNDEEVPKRELGADFDISTFVENTRLADAIVRPGPAMHIIEDPIAIAANSLVQIACGICEEDFNATEGISCRSRTADHVFCRDCVEGHVRASVENGRVCQGGQGVPCLADCDSYIAQVDFADIVPADVLQRVELLLANEAMNACKLIPEYCVECNNPQTFDYSTDENLEFLCVNCGLQFCRKCYKSWEQHRGNSCADLVSFLENERKQLEEQLTGAVTRSCSRCHAVVQKESGCNKITCKCGMTLCYVCGQSGIDYNHYKQAGVRCVLHEDRNAAMNEERTNILRQAQNVDEETRRRLQ